MVQKIVSRLWVFFLAGSFFTDPLPANSQEPEKDWKVGIRMKSNIERGQKTGVKIVGIIENSPAEGCGLQAGDILHSIDGQLFNDPLAVRADVMGNDRKQITIVYQRGATFLEIPIKLDSTIIVTEQEVVADQPGGLITKKKVAQRVLKKMTVIGKPKEIADPRQN